MPCFLVKQCGGYASFHSIPALVVIIRQWTPTKTRRDEAAAYLIANREKPLLAANTTSVFCAAPMPLAWIPSNSRTCLRTYAPNAVARVFVMHHTYPMCRHARGNGVVRTSHWRASPRTCIEQPHPQ